MKYWESANTLWKFSPHTDVSIIDKCISGEGETRKVIIQLEEGKKQLEIEKNELLTALEDKQKELQQLTSTLK